MFVRRKLHPGSKTAASARPERPRTALATMRTGKEREPEFQNDANTVQVTIMWDHRTSSQDSSLIPCFIVAGHNQGFCSEPDCAPE